MARDEQIKGRFGGKKTREAPKDSPGAFSYPTIFGTETGSEDIVSDGVNGLHIRDHEEVKKHCRTLIDYNSYKGPVTRTQLKEAVDYFGFAVYGKSYYDTTMELEELSISIVPSIRLEAQILANMIDEIPETPIITSTRTAAIPDFFDLLRDLDEALKALSAHIRSINDPTRLTTDLKAARAYVDAFREFLDVQGNQTPAEMPEAIPRGMLTKFSHVDWAKVSEKAADLVAIIVRITTKIF